MYGTEYQNTNSIVPNSHDKDVPCAVCYVSTRTTLYMMPAKYTCPSGWTTEYYGYLVAERNHPNHHRSQFICVDKLLKQVTGTYYNHDGAYLSFVEGRCETLLCPPYEETKELTCAVCTKYVANHSNLVPTLYCKFGTVIYLNYCVCIYMRLAIA